MRQTGLSLLSWQPLLTSPRARQRTENWSNRWRGEERR